MTGEMRAIDPKVWWRLGVLAETRHQTIEQLLMDVALGHTVVLRRGGIAGVKPGERRARVAEMHARGLSDVQIAATLGCHPQTVLYHRHHLNLPPNKATTRKKSV